MGTKRIWGRVMASQIAAAWYEEDKGSSVKESGTTFPSFLKNQDQAFEVNFQSRQIPCANCSQAVRKGQ